MEEIKVSGNIYKKIDKYEKDGCAYIARNPVTKQGWAFPTRDITPWDLIALALDLQKQREKK